MASATGPKIQITSDKSKNSTHLETFKNIFETKCNFAGPVENSLKADNYFKKC
jgi:hypothetical protein